MYSLATIDNTLKHFLLEQKYVNTALYLFLILYAGLAAPKLPSYISKLFNNAIFRVLILFLIAYLASKDVEAAILVSVGLVITLMTLNHHKVNEKITSLLNMKAEGFMPNDTRDILNAMPYSDKAKASGKPDPRLLENFSEPFDGPEYALI